MRQLADALGPFGSSPRGRQRPLGIPNVFDRVLQQAMLQVLQPQLDEILMSRVAQAVRDKAMLKLTG